MNGRSFVDTNILVYTDDKKFPDKQRHALALYGKLRRERSGVVSTQVLQEYFVSATKKLRVDPSLAQRKVEIFARLDVVKIDVDHIFGAIDLSRLHQLSFWDALIVKVAASSGCTILLSEDMQHGRRFGSLEIVNPFA